MAVALLSSVAANLSFAIQVLVFDPNRPFYPICFTQAHGLVVLTEPMSVRFKERILVNPTHSKQLRTDGRVYISWWNWRREKGWNWNLTRQIAEQIHRESTGKKISAEDMDKLKTESCDFIRKYALEKPKSR